ncbi:MAG TPA: cofactor-independent phosphoglycerate mutase [Planctomycetaceae bacterium]|nr:cofactor-independent phosphoglycerate mutase [Planctomycetaceae bacterium]
MKYALVIPDGCADEPQESLGGRTPLQAARTPHMDEIARLGLVGRAETVPAAMTPGSDVGTMSLFGYDPLVYHTGRAPIEAAAQGIELGPDDWAIRCNLVTIEDGVMRSFTAGQIPNGLAGELIELLQKDRCGDPRWKFHAGVSYRNLLIFRGRGGPAPFTRETATTPPHDVTDQPVESHLPKGPGADALLELMDRCVGLFAACEANQRRRARGELPATGIWLWGLGQAPSLEPFAARFGTSGAVITAVDLLRGLGRLLGWKIIRVPGATGYLDTDYAAKGQSAIDALSEVDLIVVHVEATDEASHEGDAAAKVAALERIDAEIVGPLHEFLRSRDEYRILVSPDHPTFLRTRTHSHGAVPFAMCGSGCMPDAAARYDEATASASAVCLPGHELMPLLLQTG